MPLHSGIDLHSTNSYLVILDGELRVVAYQKMANDPEKMVGFFEPPIHTG